MTPQERDILLPLLDRLRQTHVAVKDAEADQMIRQAVQAQPDAPYVLAQTVLMQDYTLHAAQERIRALEQQLAQAQQGQHASGGGFLGGLFGGGRPAPAPPPPPGYGQNYGQGYAQGYGQNLPPNVRPSYGAQIMSAVQPGAGAPSFLRSAAQTAAGVAGGMLLAEGMEGLFSHHDGGASGFLGGAPGGFGAASVDRFVENASNTDGFVGNAPGGFDDRDAFVNQGDAGQGDAGYADANGGDAGYASDVGDTSGGGGDAFSGDAFSGDDGSGGGFDDDLNS